MGTVDYSAFTETIRESVSALQIGRDYGLNPGLDGRCQCIFCSGARDDTLKLYGHNRGFYCYRCHRFGDVITLHMEITGTGFRQAVEDLNSQYGLNLPLKDADLKAVQKAKEFAEKRKQERIEKEHRDRELLEQLWDAADAVQTLEQCLETCAPESPDDQWRQRFVVALRYLPQLTYLRDCLYDEVYRTDKNFY